MSLVLLVTICGLAGACLALLIVLLRRKAILDPETLEAIINDQRRIEQSMREEFGRNREESSRAAAHLREELATRIGQFGDSSDARLTRLRQELNDAHGQSRAETRQGFSEFQGTVRDALALTVQTQSGKLTEFGQRIERVTESVEHQLEKIRQTVDQKLSELQARNEQKLEEMRRTVDEKLEGTLEKRLGDSFKLVSERLEAVHKGLGEMQVMATSVGDLKRVLTNVKARGTWGEIQ